MKAAVLGTTGYTGLLLLRLLSNHPQVSEILPVSSSRPGDRLNDVDPGLGNPGGRIRERLLDLAEAVREKPDVVFSALPHLESARLCEPFYGQSVLIDLSADFRFNDPGLFEQAYGQAPPRADLLPQAVYGLCEWYRSEIKKSDIIANPGCYPTAALLPLLPLVAEGIVTGPVQVFAISGISGAGRKPDRKYLFCEIAENATAYAPGKNHRHSWEMESELKRLAPDTSVLFVPHLAPLRRGIAATIQAALARPEDEADAAIAEIYQHAYGGEPFIRLRGKGIPQTREVRGSNRCDIGWHIVEGRLLLFSCIDNLMKGASGQAVQSMNIRFGFEESSGLPVDSEL